MSGPPELPREISANGAEIWDWARQLSAWQQRQARIAELRKQIAHVRCGSCFFWMKSSQCPRETRVNGRRSGPSCEGSTCSKFQEDPIWSTPGREKRRAELAELLATGTPS